MLVLPGIECPVLLQERLNLLERLEQRPLKVRPKEDYERIVSGLSNAELESMIDLRPFMQRNPFVVQADANLSRTYRLFRTMGLRHLFVGPPQPKVTPPCPLPPHCCCFQQLISPELL